MALSSHQSAAMKHDEWLTPPEILRPLGAFDLDPCAPIMRPWDTAAKHLNVNDDGLRQPWHGRVWCNPPFGREAVKWLNRTWCSTKTALPWCQQGRKPPCSMPACGVSRMRSASSRAVHIFTTHRANGPHSTAGHPSVWSPTENTTLTCCEHLGLGMSSIQGTEP